MGNVRTPKSYNLCCLEGGNQWFWGAPMFIFGTTHTGRCASLGRPHWSVVVSPQSVAHHRIWGIYTSEIKICHAVSSNGAGWLPMNIASWNLQQKSNMKSFPMSVGCTLHHCAPPPWFRFWLNCPIACWLGWPLASSKCGTSSRWPHCNVTGVMGIGLGGNGRWVAELFRLANGSELFYVGDPFFEVSIILFAAPPPCRIPGRSRSRSRTCCNRCTTSSTASGGSWTSCGRQRLRMIWGTLVGVGFGLGWMMPNT